MLPSLFLNEDPSFSALPIKRLARSVGRAGLRYTFKFALGGITSFDACLGIATAQCAAVFFLVHALQS